MLPSVLWTELATPAALVDLDRVEANTARMSERMRRFGVRLRPHVKTHKCVEAARLQVRGHFGGITVSTLAEARFFGEAGFRDITYAVPIAPARVDEALGVASELDELNVLVDHVDTLKALEAASLANRVIASAYLKVDCGYHRAGVDPESDDSVTLALRMHETPRVRFRGILTHAGHSYLGKTPQEIRAIGEQERLVMARFAEKLARAGARPTEVSVGSTPTMSLCGSLDGVTEARPGNYAFYDRFQAAVGSCSLEDVAFSVLVSVTGHYPERNEMLIDAGALAFSKDEGPTHIDPECGFGAIVSVPDGRALETWTVASLSQEHGKIRGRTPIPFEEFPIGSKLRIVPNHSCLSAALFDRYHVSRGERVVDEWKPVRGW
jgi:D-serine deaminase-like pyridoxal phosphate-dependent protein